MYKLCCSTCHPYWGWKSLVID